MLAIKTVLAGRDEIDTLIFDEIDTGISGRTAWKVAEQLSVLSGAHQVHLHHALPQIAAMADVHFVIEKSSTDDMIHHGHSESGRQRKPGGTGETSWQWMPLPKQRCLMQKK